MSKREASTIVGRVMQNLRQTVNISPEHAQNLIRYFAIDNHISSVLRYKFYSGIVNVVEVAEQIRIDKPKNCTKISEAAHLDKASCTTPPQSVEQFSLHTCTPKFNDTIIYTLVN